MKRWNLHLDHPWSECVRDDGAPKRLYITTPWGFWQIALSPGDRSQVYDRKTATYTNRFGWVTFRPPR